MSDLRLITPPEGYPVTLAQAKAHLRVDFADDDDVISGFIAAATEDLDGKSGALYRCLLPQTWVQTLDYTFPICDEGMIELPLGPVSAITSVTYIDPDGSQQTVPTSIYEFHPTQGLDSASLRLKWLQTWPEVRRQRRAISVTYSAGYTDASSVPSALRTAIMIHVANLYENRGADGQVELPDAYLHLISRYRGVYI